MRQPAQCRFFSARILVSHLPREMEKQEILSRFSKCGPIEQVQIIKNSLGQSSGKALVTYKYKKNADEAVLTFNDRAVDDMVCAARPVIEKGETSSRKEAGQLSRRVYLMNVPYDAYPSEIEALCREFAPVDKVVIPRDP